MTRPASAGHAVLGAMLFRVCADAAGGSLEVTVAGPESYQSAVAHAQPGAIIRLKPGIYNAGLPLRELNGTPDKPIVIEAANPSRPPQFLAHPGNNTVSIVNASYVTVRNLVLDGRNLPVDAVKAEGHSRFAHHVTLEGLRIIGYGMDQSIVGISTKCPAWGWVIRRNVILHAGTGMYLGDSDGSAPFFASVIEYNLVVDPLGYGIQIKHQLTRPTDSGAAVGPQTTIIRHNVLSKYGNASEGRMARPNLLVGHFPKSGSGRDDRYLIYGNFFYANATEALFQGEGNVALYANILVNPFGDAIHIQPHNDVPKNIWLFNNTVVSVGRGIELQGAATEYLHLFHANVVFARRHPTSTPYMGNLAGGYEDAGKYLVDPIGAPGRMNLQLKPAARWNGSKRPPLTETLPDSDRDFDGRPLSDGDVGAYARSTGPPSWLPSVSIKPAVPGRSSK